MGSILYVLLPSWSESEGTSEENITCPICEDIFREPVLLPCEHSFCRECMDVYSSHKGKTKHKHRKPTIISCPVCLSLVYLGVNGVAGLPVHHALEIVANKHREEFTIDKDVPTCSVCEDQGRISATSHCLTCQLFYCQKCLTAVHPMKGQLKGHQIITIGINVFGQTTANGLGKDGASSREFQPTPLCDCHLHPYCLFCYTCEQLMCLQCIALHNKHITGDIQSAYEQYKVPFESRSTEFTELKEEVDKISEELAELNNDIQMDREHWKAQIRKLFDDLLEDVYTRKQMCLDRTDVHFNNWGTECQTAVRDLYIQAEKMDVTIKSSKDLLCGQHALFLKNSKELISRMEDISLSVKDNIKNRIDMKENFRSETNGTFLADPDVLPHRLEVQQKVGTQADENRGGPARKTKKSKKRNMRSSDKRGVYL